MHTQSMVPILMACCIFSLIFAEHKRIKRRVVFSKSSKFFFRLNGKDNILNHTEIFAHGWALRINWDLPDTLHRRYKFFKREIYDDTQNIPNKFAEKGFACIIKYLCNVLSTINETENCGLFCNIGNIIKRSNSREATFFKSIFYKCDYYSTLCPYSLNSNQIN